MHKKALMPIVLSIAAVLHATAPVSPQIGAIAVSAAQGSITEKALRASSEPYTESWLEEYTASPYVFGEAYSSVLSTMLPFSNPVAGKERNGAVDILDLDTGSVLSFVFEDGMVAAVLPVRQSEGS